LLRLRSDEQLVAMFRAGDDDAFRAIHDRYRARLLAYARQMLPGRRQDAEDALQDVFIRAHASLRASGRTITLRAWLYRIAHNRCVDELRRPAPPAPEALALVRPPAADPVAEAERRESLRRLVQDVRALPDQQRSALLMRELEGISYQELAGALDVSVPAVKSLLVRARVGLAQAQEARDAPCPEMREELVLAVDRGVRPGGLARRHLGECEGCRAWRADLRRQRRSLAALAPVGPLAFATKLLGLGGIGSGSAGGGAAAATGGGAVAAGATVGGGTIGLTHVAAVLAAAVVTAGGAVEVEHSLSARKAPRSHAVAAPAAVASPSGSPAARAPRSPAAASVDSAGSQAASPQAPAATGPSDQSQQGAADEALPPADASGGAAAPSDDPGQPPEPATTGPSGSSGSAPSSTPATGGSGPGSPEASGTATTLPAPPAGAPPDAPGAASAAPPAP